MSPDSAVLAALDLHRRPSLSTTLQGRPVPNDVLLVIRGAAGCPETIATLRARTGAPAELLREACALYIQRVMLFQHASPYRIFGAEPGTSRADLRQRLRWLLLWLHPDHNRNEWQAAYTRRIIEAWRTLSGDRAPAGLPPPVAVERRSARFRQTWVKYPLAKQPTRRAVITRRVAGMRVVLLSSALYFLAPASIAPAQGSDLSATFRPFLHLQGCPA